MFKSLLLTGVVIGISAATMSLPAQAKWPTSSQVDVRDHPQQNDVRNHRRPRRSNEKIYAQSGNKWGSTFSGVGSYNGPRLQKSTLRVCKRAMSAAASDPSKSRGQNLAIKIWQRNATNLYGSPASWGVAKNKRVTCRFSRSQATYKCKAIANPCFRGTFQNRQ